MKILFICSGKIKSGISPIILNQGKSISEIGHDVSYFAINEKGLLGYLKYIFILRKFVKKNSFDIYHAHYNLCGFVAVFAGARPLVVSLMGTDVLGSGFIKLITLFFSRFFWKKTIVKSLEMKFKLGNKLAEVIPNGVDFNKFKPMDRELAIKFLKWDENKKHILFAASMHRLEKNYLLFEKAYQTINDTSICIHTLEDVDNNLLPFYYNASNVIVLPSKHEGSPNVIKEAMACNRPIVATNVGDIKEVIKDTEGCYLTNPDHIDFANKIKMALKFNSSTRGRDRILHLKSEEVAKKIVEIYNNYSK